MTGDASEPVWSVGRGRTLDLAPGRLPHLMAVVNCTPDSFSDGGAHADAAAAAAHAERCAEAGATLLDVGGESTRPGAAPVDGLEQIRRTRSVVAALAGRTKALISIDTTRAEVAAARAGADNMWRFTPTCWPLMNCRPLVSGLLRARAVPRRTRRFDVARRDWSAT